MFNQTEIDLRHAEYIARTASINRERWMKDMASTEAWRTREQGTFFERIRQRFGNALIDAGERLQRTAPDYTAAPAKAKYDPAI